MSTNFSKIEVKDVLENARLEPHSRYACVCVLLHHFIMVFHYRRFNKLSHVRRNEFSNMQILCIVVPNNFDILVKLSFNHKEKILKGL